MKHLLKIIVGLGVVVFSQGMAFSKESPVDPSVKADEIAQKVSKLRGLAIKKPIKRGVMSKEQIKERLLQRIDEDYTAKQIHAEEFGLKRFGLFPWDKDYLKTVVSMMTEQIAGFYDPKEKQLYIANEMGFGGDVVMSHEIDHAIQDQHYDLNVFLKEKKDNNDEMVARQALLEGDGTVLMMEYTGALKFNGNESVMVNSIAGSMAASMGSMAQYPMVLRESMIFPYAEGMKFVAHFRGKGDWSHVDALYIKGPESSEHILHPELFEAGHKPIRVTTSLPKFWQQWDEVQNNTAGEFALSLLLRKNGVADGVAKNAAAGWGGDKMIVLAPNPNETNVSSMIGLLGTTWDTQKDADEFYDAMITALPQLTGTRGVRHDANKVVHKMTDEGGLTTLTRQGLNVALVIAAPPARAKELDDALHRWGRE